ncbi:DUF3301 domain-containing protein [Kangiella sp. HZ709]|uniref:DUF3301 domain-containing protein n=1 Tax=Kangiella sp. HZ709 TaxID=2666328 RepID=UPI0012B0D6D9|nr:DUF3301 domain-containing protein [Kangiella sp. HZ709]MRX27631.1 DUF3301 domain-containing protein [Kangiella sp. HZ709]
MDQLLIILTAALAVGFYFYNSRIREAAHRAAINACKESNVQNLDGYVSLKKIYFGRNPENQLRFLKRYQFEFATTGSKRYIGHIIMQGKHPIIVEMESTEEL